MIIVAAVAVLWVASGLAAARIASSKAVDPTPFLVGGLLSGPFALHAALTLPHPEDEDDLDEDYAPAFTGEDDLEDIPGDEPSEFEPVHELVDDEPDADELIDDEPVHQPVADHAFSPAPYTDALPPVEPIDETPSAPPTHEDDLAPGYLQPWQTRAEDDAAGPVSIIDLAQTTAPTRSRWDAGTSADLDDVPNDDLEEEPGTDLDVWEQPQRPGFFARLFSRFRKHDDDEYGTEDFDDVEDLDQVEDFDGDDAAAEESIADDIEPLHDDEGFDEEDLDGELVDDEDYEEEPIVEYSEIRIFGIKIFSRVKRSSAGTPIDHDGPHGYGDIAPANDDDIEEITAPEMLDAPPAHEERLRFVPLPPQEELVEEEQRDPEPEPHVFGPLPPADETPGTFELDAPPEELPVEDGAVEEVPVEEVPVDEVHAHWVEPTEVVPEVYHEPVAVAPTEPTPTSECPHCGEVSYPNFYGGCENCGQPLFVADNGDQDAGRGRFSLRRSRDDDSA